MQKESSGCTSTHALLALWSLEKKEGKAVSRSKLSKYENLIENLEKSQAIVITSGIRYTYLSLTESGKRSLIEGLQSADFSFCGTIASSREVNDALVLLRQHASASGSVSNGKVEETIASYDEFKQVALEVYDRLNRDYNMDNLVPIYRIRREIGERVSRSHFDEWLLEMQANDVFQLLEGSVEDSAPDKIEDSVMTRVSGLRCYAKRLEP